MKHDNRRPIRTAVDRQSNITVTDSAQADLAALITAHSLQPGGFFVVLGTGDTTDNALEGIKGSAPAAGDRFYLKADGETVIHA